MGQNSHAFPTGPVTLPNQAGFPWRRVVIIVGVLLLPVLYWVVMGLLPEEKKEKKTAHATITRTTGKNVLDGVPRSAVGIGQEDPIPPPEVKSLDTHTPPPDTYDRDKLIDQLTRDNAALLAELKKRPTPPPVTNSLQKPQIDQDAKRLADERRKEDDDARKTLDVWTATAETMKGGLQMPKTVWSLPPATVIHCETQMEVTNQVHGAFIARVTHPVRSAHGHVVIPPLSRLLMTPSGWSIAGDERLPVEVSKLTFPNDAYIDLKKATVADQAGAAGFKDQIDRRWGSLVASIALTGVLRAGSGVVGGYDSGTAERIGGAVASETASQGTQQVRQTIRTEPILTIRPNWPCMLILEEPMELPGPWEG